MQSAKMNEIWNMNLINFAHFLFESKVYSFPYYLKKYYSKFHWNTISNNLRIVWFRHHMLC